MTLSCLSWALQGAGVTAHGEKLQGKEAQSAPSLLCGLRSSEEGPHHRQSGRRGHIGQLQAWLWQDLKEPLAKGGLDLLLLAVA